MNSDQAKRLIEDASASTGQPDAHWEATGVDRLYFHDPRDPETSGAVDVQRTANGAHVERVKVDLWVPVSMVAEIVAKVTGAKISARRAAPVSDTSALPPVVLGYVAEPVVPANENATPAPAPAEPETPFEPERVKLPITPLALRDELRRLELVDLVKQQEEDERNEALQEEREEQESEPEELDVESLAL